MARLCERPGCAQPATVAYGMSADGLIVWLEPYDGASTVRMNALCRRHADAMAVPKGWTLDDRREPLPRLFVPPASDAPAPKQKRRPKARRTADDTGQLALGAATEAEAEDGERADHDGAADAASEVAGADVTTEVWRPVFDQTDDLGGLLSAKSPLLSRAFGRRDRTEPSEGPDE